MSKVIGIDLGTTNSVVAVMEADSPPTDLDRNLTGSSVSLVPISGYHKRSL